MNTLICFIRKIPVYFLSGLFILTLSCSDSNNSGNADGKNSFATLESLFTDPPSEYRSMPLWVCNGKVTEAELDRMLIELKDAGFGGLFVHPRPGMITESLSDDWF